MRFVIITHAVHKIKDDTLFSYGPYVDEMNLWTNYVSNIEVVAPLSNTEIDAIEKKYNCSYKFTRVASFDITSIINSFLTLLKLPLIILKIFNAMNRADHIHLRCPGNIGLLGCLVQVFFPSKPKTVKYAGNWDPKSKQPISYKLQQCILRNTFLTKNTQVLVYGDWNESSKNITPFFTASYFENEKRNIENKKLNSQINFLFVGTLSEGKQPLISIKVVHGLLKKGYNVKLNMYGEGSERKNIETYILKNNLQETVVLHGNKPKDIIKEAYKKAHFLVFISKSEGWPKVIAEAMFWKCLPISTAVSCVPNMLANGERGSLVAANIKEIVSEIELYLKNEQLYLTKAQKAFDWSRTYTLDKFENEIKKLLF